MNLSSCCAEMSKRRAIQSIPRIIDKVVKRSGGRQLKSLEVLSGTTKRIDLDFLKQLCYTLKRRFWCSSACKTPGHSASEKAALPGGFFQWDTVYDSGSPHPLADNFPKRKCKCRNIPLQVIGVGPVASVVAAYLESTLRPFVIC